MWDNLAGMRTLHPSPSSTPACSLSTLFDSIISRISNNKSLYLKEINSLAEWCRKNKTLRIFHKVKELIVILGERTHSQTFVFKLVA